MGAEGGALDRLNAGDLQLGPLALALKSLHAWQDVTWPPEIGPG